MYDLIESSIILFLHGYGRQLPLTGLISICMGLKCQEKVVGIIACIIVHEQWGKYA
jgi:hypothetical protein